MLIPQVKAVEENTNNQSSTDSNTDNKSASDTNANSKQKDSN